MNARWVADPGVAWNIVLTARLAQPPSYDELRERVLDLNHQLTGTRAGATVEGTDVAVLRQALARDPAGAVGAGLAGADLVISAHHQFLDGLGLLAALGELTGLRATSSARGIGDRPARAGAWSTRVQRLREVVTSPPDRVPAAGGSTGADWDSFAAVPIEGSLHGSQLVHAAVRGVGVFTARHGGRQRRPAVAVGATRVDGAAPRLGDHSALIRLTDLAGADADDVRRRLRTAAPEAATAAEGHSASLVASLTGVAMRLLASRLGSTVLVSHLGEVTAPGVEELAFHPVTGGGSGLSVGAVTLAGRTTLSARGRGARHSEDALAELVRDIVAAARPDHR